MTVRELISALSALPQDAPVIAQWEGTWNTVEPENIEESKSRGGRVIVLMHVDGMDPVHGTEKCRRVYRESDLDPQPA